MVKRTGKSNKKSTRLKAFRQTDLKALQQQRMFVDSIIRLADPLCAAEGLELVHVEYQREPGGLTLRCYVDKPGGITLDDCVEVSRQLDDLMDVHIDDMPPYRLEVSSPGLDRPVGKLNDFMRFKGQRAKIRTDATINGRQNFTGVLVGVVDDTVQIQVNNEMVSLNFDTITRARLINYNGES